MCDKLDRTQRNQLTHYLLNNQEEGAESQGLFSTTQTTPTPQVMVHQLPNSSQRSHSLHGTQHYLFSVQSSFIYTGRSFIRNRGSTS